MMKRASGARTFSRILALVVVVVVSIGYYSHVRAQNGGLPEQGMVIPLRPLAPLSTVPVPPVFGMEGILADKTAAIKLGKALFWDMQAGSDDTQACASCHFNAGADSRTINEVNPGQAGGDNSFQMGSGPNYHLSAGSANAGFGGYHDGDFPFHKVADPKDRFSIISDVNDVTGSQGVFATTHDQILVETKLNPPGIGDINSGGSNPLPGHDRADGGDDEGLTFGKDSHPGPTHKFPPSRENLKNRGKDNQRGNMTVPQEPTKNVNSTEVTTSIADAVFSYPDP